MDLTTWLLGRTPPRPYVVATPGGTAQRLAVERIVRAWGWRPAISPAETNLLVVAGAGTDEFAPFVQTVWRSVPVPRVRVEVDSAARAEESLAAAVAALRDPERQRADAARPADTLEPHHPAAADPSDSDHGVQQHGMPDAHGAHHGHHMGAMAMPGGIPMADRAPDRDGLMLDRLTVPLGPVLADWPAGLVIRTALQGDVIQEASVAVLGSGTGTGHGFWQGHEVARRLDGCARLLAVAGWESAAIQARSLRDDVLLGQSDRRAVDRWVRRVRRSRVLRWSLTGLGVLSGQGWDGTVYAGDAYDRLTRWLDFAADEPVLTDAVLASLPELLVGSELAGARLVIASLDPDTELLAGSVTTHD
jgi:hypothetical protein